MMFFVIFVKKKKGVVFCVVIGGEEVRVDYCGFCNVEFIILWCLVLFVNIKIEK